MYVPLWFILNRLVKLLSTRRKREFQNEKFLITVGLNPTTSSFLDLRYNQLRHGTTLIIDINRYPYQYRYT